MKRLRSYESVGRNLLAGAAVFLPLVLLALVAVSFSGLIRRFLAWLGSILALFGIHGLLASVLAVLGGLLGLFLLLLAVGTLVRHRYGEWLFGRFDSALAAVPVIGPFYQEFRRARRLLIGDRSAFRTVATVELSAGVDVLAFVVTRDGEAALGRSDLGADRVTVFVPLAPNPMVGGHLLAVEDDRVTETDISVRAALATVLTMGTEGAEIAEPPLAGLYHERSTSPPSREGPSPSESPSE